MKRILFIITCIIVNCTISKAQVKGPERIVGSYTGEQKKELAQGKGKSVGKDTYEGTFKKGLPTQGTYTFGEDIEMNGFKYAKGDIYEGEFSDGLFDGKGKLTFLDKAKPVVDGYWKNGKYQGRTKLGYEVLKKSNISRVVVQKNGTVTNKISVYGIMDIVEIGSKNVEFNPKEINDIPKNLDVNVSSTSSTDGPNKDLTDKTLKTIEIYSDLPQNKFPFIVNVKGTVPSNGTKAELQVLIENPGNWTIIVYTN